MVVFSVDHSGKVSSSPMGAVAECQLLTPGIVESSLLLCYDVDGGSYLRRDCAWMECVRT